MDDVKTDRGRRSQWIGGFTMIEVLAVLSLMGVLLGISVVRLHRTGRELVSARDQLIQGLAYAQGRAMATTNTWVIHYNSDGAALERDGVAIAFPAEISFPARISLDSGDVRFLRSGVPNGGGTTIDLTDTVSGEVRTIVIDGITGRIE